MGHWCVCEGTNRYDMEASVTSPSGTTELCDIQDLGQSHYSIKFVPKEMGIHTVSVKHRGMHIPGQSMPQSFSITHSLNSRFKDNWLLFFFIEIHRDLLNYINDLAHLMCLVRRQEGHPASKNKSLQQLQLSCNTRKSRSTQLGEQSYSCGAWKQRT